MFIVRSGRFLRCSGSWRSLRGRYSRREDLSGPFWA